MSVQQFCLRWNNHQPNFISVCSSLLHNGTLVDVTLAAEGRQLQAHKIVLSACSSYFQALFTTNPCQHPIVILKDVQYDDLKTMVDFMYYGEVNVSQEQLPHILKTAEMLKIKGLAEMPTDPANLTKSDSKSSSDATELLGQAGANVASQATGAAASSLGAASGSSSAGDSLWSSSEAQQFQQHHQQQLQQQLQQQQQAQQQQQQQQQQQHQQQQQQQQQQQHHHHHHHHQAQQQQQSGQAQGSQTHHHQLRRTPSPLSAGTSPATRRKRLRKSSNNGSGERHNSEEQHGSTLDVAGAAGSATGLSLAQMSQMSFGAGAGGNSAAALGGLSGHSMHTAKLLKEATSNELEQQPQDSDLDDGHGHIHMQIKPEVDIGGVNQTMPLDISGTTTPSEHDAPNSQSSHSGLQWTVVDSNYSRFSMPACQSNLIGNGNGGTQNSAANSSAGVGTAGTNDQRQQHETQQQVTQQQHLQQLHYQQQQPQGATPEPSPAHVSHSHPTLAIAYSHSQGTNSSSSVSLERTPSEDTPTDLQTTQSTAVMGSKRNRVLTRQPRVKRDSDSISSTNQISPDTAATTLDFDPFNAAGTTSVTARDYSTHHHHQVQQQSQHQQHHHLLTVPPRIERHASEPAPSLTSATPHLLSVPSSTPYLIKQHSDPLLPRGHSHHATSSGNFTGSNPFAPLHRQYSHPLSGSNASYIPPAALHHSHHISLPESIYASGSPPPAGSSQYPVPARIVTCTPSSSETAVTPTNSGGTPVSVVTSPTTGLNSSSRQAYSPSYGGSTDPDSIPERRSSHSPLTNAVERVSTKVETANGGGNKLRSSKSTGSNSGYLHPSQATASSSFEHLPTLRVKNEELQRSVSSPQTQREIITLENPRSSHCPVIRPGPALGCNFCWNTIDGHGRILRRKTKYHCPECQTNLCIVPCFQEYHERLNNDAATVNTSENQVNSSSSSKGNSFVSTGGGASRVYTKTESI